MPMNLPKINSLLVSGLEIRVSNLLLSISSTTTVEALRRASNKLQTVIVANAISFIIFVSPPKAKRV